MNGTTLVHFREPTTRESTLVNSLVWSSFRTFIGTLFFFLCLVALLGLLGYALFSGYLPIVSGFVILLFWGVVTVFGLYGMAAGADATMKLRT